MIADRPSLAAALEEFPISAELAAPSEQPGLGAHRSTPMWHTVVGLVEQRESEGYGDGTRHIGIG